MDNLVGGKRPRLSKSSLNGGEAHQDETPPAGGSDKTIFSLLPEIWDEILPNLSAADFQSLINSSPDLNQFFEGDKTTLLLPLVLPLLMNYIPLHSLLQLRGVRRSSKSLIDEALQHVTTSILGYWASTFNPGRIHYLAEKRVYKVAHLLSQTMAYQSHPSLSRFLLNKTVEEVGSANPFLTRSFSVTARKHEALLIGIPAEVQKATRLSFMTRFGHHLKAFKARVVASGFGRSDWYADAALEFISLLHHTPNLRILSMEPWKNMLQQGTRLRNTQAPELPHLELLDFGVSLFFYRDDDVHHEAYEEQLQTWLFRHYGAQLKALMCTGTFIRSYPQYTERMNATAPKISRLRVTGVCLESLQRLSRLSWPLEELQFIGEATDGLCYNLGGLLKAINSFSGTLCTLDIFVNLERSPKTKEQLVETCRGSAEVLPKVKKFGTALKNVGLSWFFELFAAKFPNLEELNLYSYVLARNESLTPGMHVLPAERGFEAFPKLERIVVLHSPGDLRNARKLVITRDGSGTKRIFRSVRNWEMLEEKERE